MVTKFFFATKTEVRSSRFHYYLDNPLPMWNSFSVFFVDLSIRTKERKCPNENRINFSFWITQKKIDIETKAQESNSVESSSSYLPSLLCRSFFFCRWLENVLNVVLLTKKCSWIINLLRMSATCLLSFLVIGAPSRGNLLIAIFRAFAGFQVEIIKILCQFIKIL